MILGLGNDLQSWYKMILLGFAAVSSLHVWPAFTLTADNIAIVIQRAAWITSTQCATIPTFR